MSDSWLPDHRSTLKELTPSSYRSNWFFMKKSIKLTLHHTVEWLWQTLHLNQLFHIMCTVLICPFVSQYMSSFLFSNVTRCHVTCLSLLRVPQSGVQSDWPSSVHFTFQLYRFPPVTTERLKLLDPQRNSRISGKSTSDYPCVLSLINRDGTLSSGMISIHIMIRSGTSKHCLIFLTCMSFLFCESIPVCIKMNSGL